MCDSQTVLAGSERQSAHYSTGPSRVQRTEPFLLPSEFQSFRVFRVSHRRGGHGSNALLINSAEGPVWAREWFWAGDGTGPGCSRRNFGDPWPRDGNLIIRRFSPYPMACSGSWACCPLGILLVVLTLLCLSASPVHGHDGEHARVALLHPLHREVMIIGPLPPLDPMEIHARVFGVESALARGLMLQVYLSSG